MRWEEQSSMFSVWLRPRWQSPEATRANVHKSGRIAAGGLVLIRDFYAFGILFTAEAEKRKMKEESTFQGNNNKDRVEREIIWHGMEFKLNNNWKTSVLQRILIQGLIICEGVAEKRFKKASKFPVITVITVFNLEQLWWLKRIFKC